MKEKTGFIFFAGVRTCDEYDHQTLRDFDALHDIPCIASKTGFFPVIFVTFFDSDLFCLCFVSEIKNRKHFETNFCQV